VTEEASPVTSAEILQAASQDVSVVRGLAPLYADCYVCGPAMTCACAACDNLAMHYALMTAPPGTVMVCAANGLLDCGYFGELAGIDAQNRGLLGLVMDGSIRDAADLERLKFPIFYAGTAPSSCTKKSLISLGETVVVRGVAINPGDQIVADRDAVVVIRKDRWPDVEKGAEAVHERENAMRARLREGEPLSSMISLPADAPATEASTR